MKSTLKILKRIHLNKRDQLRLLYKHKEEAEYEAVHLMFYLIAVAEPNLGPIRSAKLWRYMLRYGYVESIRKRIEKLINKVKEGNDDKTTFSIDIIAKGIPKHPQKRAKQGHQT